MSVVEVSYFTDFNDGLEQLLSPLGLSEVRKDTGYLSSRFKAKIDDRIVYIHYTRHSSKHCISVTFDPNILFGFKSYDFKSGRRTKNDFKKNFFIKNRSRLLDKLLKKLVKFTKYYENNLFFKKKASAITPVPAPK